MKKKHRPYYFKRLNTIGLPGDVQNYYKSSRQEQLYAESYELLCSYILDESKPENEHNVKINYANKERLYNSVNAELFRETNMSSNLRWITSPLLTVIVVTFTGFILNKYTNVLPIAGDILIVLGVILLGILVGKLFVAPEVNFRILYLQEVLRMIEEIAENTYIAVELEQEEWAENESFKE